MKILPSMCLGLLFGIVCVTSASDKKETTKKEKDQPVEDVVLKTILVRDEKKKEKEIPFAYAVTAIPPDSVSNGIQLKIEASIADAKDSKKRNPVDKLTVTLEGYNLSKMHLKQTELKATQSKENPLIWTVEILEKTMKKNASFEVVASFLTSDGTKKSASNIITCPP